MTKRVTRSATGALCTRPLQFLQLPDEVQYLILSKVINTGSRRTPFKPSDLVYAGVCKKWQKITRSLVNNLSLYELIADLVARGGNSTNQLISHIPEFLVSCKDALGRLTLNENGVQAAHGVPVESLVSNALLKQILDAASGIDTLVLALEEDRAQTMETSIFQSIREMSNLKAVHLFDYTGSFGDTTVVRLCDSCPSLENVTLGVGEMTDTAMEAVGQLQFLKSFELSENYNVTDDGMKALCNGQGRLEVLQLFLVDKLTSESARCISSGSATRSTLRALQLADAGSINEYAVSKVLGQCLQLEELFLCINGGTRDGIFSLFLEEHPGKHLPLKHLDYGHENDDFATRFCGAKCLPLLEHVVLYYDKYANVDVDNGPQEDRIGGLKVFPNLKILSIDWGEKLSAQSAKALGDCSKLEYLHLTTELEENAVQPLIDALGSRLLKLQVESVPHNCIESIAAGFTQLTNIWFSGANGLDVQARINRLSPADVGEWASEISWERLVFCGYL